MRVAVILLSVIMGAPSAMACSLPIAPWFEPPPNLSIEGRARFQEDAETDWRRQLVVWEQYRFWNLADTVFLGQIETLKPNTITYSNGSAIENLDVRDVVLRPVHWLKGEGEATSFQIGPTELGSCGPSPFWPAMNGAPGDLHVVYTAGGAPSRETVLDVIPIAEIVEFETKSRLPPPQ